MIRFAAAATRIEVYTGLEVSLTPDWTGTLEDFLADNSHLSDEEIGALKADLACQGCHRIGGGAAATFTIVTATFAAAARMACKGTVERMAGTMLEMGFGGVPVTPESLKEHGGFSDAEIAEHATAATGLARSRAVRQIAA